MKLDAKQLKVIECDGVEFVPASELEQCQAVLREIKDNSGGQIEDPHFRHWAAVTVASYFSALNAEGGADDG